MREHPSPTAPRPTGNGFQSETLPARGQELILAIQDTTTVNYNGLTATEGLDDLGGGGQGTKGILVHAGLAIRWDCS